MTRSTRPPLRPRTARLSALACVALAACSQIPPYEVPTAAVAPHYAEPEPGWLAAAPADTLARGPWWQLFADPALDGLASQVVLSNQTVAVARAAVEQSQAIVRENRAGWFPGVTVSAGATHGGAGTGSTAVTTSGYSLGLGASWEPDVWGRVSAAVSGAEAREQAGAADLYAATLSAQAALVVDYLSVREADAEIALLRTTIEGYERALLITSNRYAAAIAQKSDVLQAQTQLANARADLAALQQQRQQTLHALAVLAGQSPSAFVLPAGDWRPDVVPAVPTGIPSELLQRRPDIAAAERAVAAANTDIGAARSAWFPSLTLSANVGQSAARLADLLTASATTWSLGVAVAETLFDGGLRNAQVDAARAAWRGSVAQYRQTVLASFESVEDQLAAAESLQRQQALRSEASQAADQTEQQMLNRYREGIVAYSDVVTAQVTALSARRALLQVTLARQAAAVQMIEALGGNWQAEASGQPAS